MMSVLSPDLPGINVNVGESINLAPGSLAPLSPTKRSRTLSEGAVYLTKLPPAVANVPAEHIRTYIHSKRVNHYLVGNTLGEGSFAKVKEAFHSLVGEKVAMKIIDKKKAQQDPYVAKNFRREAKLLQMVHHANILHLLEVIETDTSFYLITELCTGGELMNYIYKKGRLDESETRKFMRQIVSAVDHLHKAGIIHRDLKVENMLLDSHQDIKIIDFGLSNEEFVQGENGLVHCNTQCGSPAYAAPELLGHKEYGPEVDIWSIGVNMYAMLTGCLPYTVEPFNITALHAKMLENKMNPIPEHLSKTCKDLLRCLLKSSPEERIKMADIMCHPWMNEGHALPFGPAPYPNKVTANDIDEDVTEHMVHMLKLKDSQEELKQELISNRSTTASAVYHLLVARLKRYRRKRNLTRPRHKTKKFSQDQGYYEGPLDDDDFDSSSTVSVPARRMSTRRQHTRGHSQPGQTGQVPLRDKADPKKDRPFSDNTLEDSFPKGYNFGRRRTLPEEILQPQLAKFRERTGSDAAAITGKGNTSSFPRSIPRAITQPDMSKSLDRRRRISPHEPPQDMTKSLDRRKKRMSPPTDMNKSLDHRRHEPHYEYDFPQLSPVHHSRPGTNAQNRAQINQLRENLEKTLHPPPASTKAWYSNPPSQIGSKNPSRQGSRNPSRAASRHPSGPLNRIAPYTSEHDKQEELVFHQVDSHTLPKYGKRNSALYSDITDEELERHLPPLQAKPPTRTSRRTHHSETQVPRRKNGYLTEPGFIEAKTDLSEDAIVSEVLRVAENMKMREIEQTAPNIVMCLHKGIRLQVMVHKDKTGLCRLMYQWLSGGEHDAYKSICDSLTRFIKF